MNTITNPTANSETTAINTRGRRRTGRRKGKIGRLPHAVREELNRRLLDGEAGGSLLAWLNGLPEKGEAHSTGSGSRGAGSAREGRPITKQNLSEWRKGGWEDWVERQESRDWMGRLTEHAQAMEDVAGGRRFSDLAASMAGLDLGLLLQATRRMEHGAEKTRGVLQIVRELVRLRTSENGGQRTENGGQRAKDGGERMRDGGWEGSRPTCGGGGAVQGSPRKLGQIEGAVEGEGDGLTRGVGHCVQDTIPHPGAPDANTSQPVAALGTTSSGQGAPGPQETDGANTKRLEVKPLHLAATDASGAVQGSPGKLGQIEGAHREKLGAGDPVRAGAGMEDGPEENSLPAIRFPFAPARAAS